MKLKIVKVGEDKKDPFVLLAKEYLKKVSPLKVTICCVAEQSRKHPQNPELVKKAEGEDLLKKSEGCFRVLLAENGKLLDTQQFASSLQNLAERHQKPVAFLVGGAYGHSQSIRDKADAIWSLSPLTFPHRLAFCVLAEQIYRSSTLYKNSPYHK